MMNIPTFFWWAPEGDPTAHELYGGPRDNTDERRDQDVIAHQNGRLVRIRGVFRPRIVKMAPEEEKKRWDRAKKSGVVTE